MIPIDGAREVGHLPVRNRAEILLRACTKIRVASGDDRGDRNFPRTTPQQHLPVMLTKKTQLLARRSLRQHNKIIQLEEAAVASSIQKMMRRSRSMSRISRLILLMNPLMNHRRQAVQFLSPEW